MEPTGEQYRGFFADTRRNIAVVTGEVVVIDVDDLSALDEVLDRCGDTPFRVGTPGGGVHCYYRARKGVPVGNRVRVEGLPVDVRGRGGYAIVPDSEIDGRPYRYVSDALPRVGELPLIRIAWSRERMRRRIETSFERGRDENDLLFRARAYLARIEPAVSGSGGHLKTFTTASKLARFVGFDVGMLWELLVEYNRRCEPPWDENELRHKFQEAMKLQHQPRTGDRR